MKARTPLAILVVPLAGAAGCGDDSASKSSSWNAASVRAHVTSLFNPVRGTTFGNIESDGQRLEFWEGRELAGGVRRAIRTRSADNTDTVVVQDARYDHHGADFDPTTNTVRVTQIINLGDRDTVMNGASPLYVGWLAVKGCQFVSSTVPVASGERWDCGPSRKVAVSVVVPDGGNRFPTRVEYHDLGRFGSPVVTFTGEGNAGDTGLFDLVAQHPGSQASPGVWRP